MNGGKDADVLVCDAVAEVSAHLIENMPNLKLIQSEGVAYNLISIETAKKRGIYVCNNKGINAAAVAEQAVLLMLSLLRNAVVSDRMVRTGLQIETKEKMMVEGILELSDCRVGLVGFGDIAKAAAGFLGAFGCETCYHSRTRADGETEKKLGVFYLDLETLIKTCDIISLHVPVTQQTINMVDREFLNKMKKTAFIINTARGEIVDNEALAEALMEGKIAGAGLDTVYPEPTKTDNILLNLPPACMDKLVLSPHIGGVTTSTFRRGHINIWKNIEAIEKSERPINIVIS